MGGNMNVNINVAGALIYALLNLVAVHHAGALQYEVESGKTKCIIEEIKMNSMTVGKFKVVDFASDDQRINVRVNAPYVDKARAGVQMYYVEQAESGKFAFPAVQQGNYVACFWLAKSYHKPPITVTVDFEWKSGVATRNWKSVAKKGNIDGMKKELKMMEDMVKSIHEEMVYLREREKEMQELNRKTNTKMARLSFLSFIIISSVVWLQLWYLKHFFKEKKLV